MLSVIGEEEDSLIDMLEEVKKKTRSERRAWGIKKVQSETKGEVEGWKPGVVGMGL
jgi:hypothetical protein